MATKFPPPPEVLAHKYGHLVFSCRASYSKKKNVDQTLEERAINGWTVRFWCKHYPFTCWGGYGKTPVKALENGIARLMENALEFGETKEIGRRDEKDKALDRAYRAATKKWRALHPEMRAHTPYPDRPGMAP